LVAQRLMFLLFIRAPRRVMIRASAALATLLTAPRGGG
jgi:hypothetical protein